MSEDPRGRYRVSDSTLVVTKPSGEIVERPVKLSFDTKLDLFEITLIGESQLKGYSFGVLQREFKRTRDQGRPSDVLPKPE